jgi:hypothetical protein
MKYAIALLLFMTLAGCHSGPTRTAGTSGVPTKDLAVLTIPQLPDMAGIKIHTIQFDNQGDPYKIDKDRDFYLLPGSHKVSFTLMAPAPPGAGGWFVPTGALTIPGPKNIPLGAVTAGKTYELAPNIESFEKLFDDGSFSLVREKAK